MSEASNGATAPLTSPCRTGVAAETGATYHRLVFSDFSPYFDRQGNPITQAEAVQLIGNIGARRVALDRIRDGLEVSTVHLVLNHGFDPGPPLIFETMVFADGEGGECWRWSTEEEAVEGHRRIVEGLRGVQEKEGEKEGEGS